MNVKLKCNSSSLVSRKRKVGVEDEEAESGSWMNSIGEKSLISRLTLYLVAGYAFGETFNKTFLELLIVADAIVNLVWSFKYRSPESSRRPLTLPMMQLLKKSGHG